MIINTIIAERIDEIEESINNNISSILLDLSDGFLGISLFYYYLFLLKKDESYLIKSIGILESVIEKLNNGCEYDSNDIIDLSKYLFFLYSKKIIEIDEIKNSLEQLEIYLITILNYKLEENDLDSINGLISLGYLFLDLSEIDSKYLTYLTKIFKIIDNLKQSKNKDNEYFWFFDVRDKGKPIVEFGYFHGTSGIINFLNCLCEKKIEFEKCKNIITKAISFLEKNKRENGINFYPHSINPSNEYKYQKYQNINYGDIGIGYTIYRSGLILHNNTFKKIGIETLENAANFRDNTGDYIKDAELIYGSAGLFAFFDKIGSEQPNKLFNTARQYWLEKTINYNNNKTKFAGYETYINGFDEDIQVSFAHGIAGIGITLINYKINLNHEYLKFFNYR
jgi:lantibiotic modifying enzyme